MKRAKIIFWISTSLIFLFQGLMSAFTGDSEMAKEGIRHLGYPEYFGQVLRIFKIIGALILIIPQVPSRIKEWAYAGFAFDFVFAAISIAIVDGVHSTFYFPLMVLGVLSLSYLSYHTLQNQTNTITYGAQAV